jgi:hypothetical protein
LAANGIANGVAIAFRTYVFNEVEMDSCEVGNTIVIGGCVIASIPEPGLSGTHMVRINESGSKLIVSLDGGQILSGSANLANAVGGNTAYVGITGADGSASETAMINSLSLTPGWGDALSALAMAADKPKPEPVKIRSPRPTLRVWRGNGCSWHREDSA